MKLIVPEPALEALERTLGQAPQPRWFTGQNRPISDAPVLGIGGPVAEALSWALARMFYIQIARERKLVKEFPDFKTYRVEGIHIMTRTAGPGATLRQDTLLGQGCWVVHNTAWGEWGSSPRALKGMAAKRLARKTGYDMKSCRQAIDTAISTCYFQWQAEKKRHYGSKEEDEPENPYEDMEEFL
ncbi:MAG: hypothetical protein PHO20_04475 [Candidatus Peribacteraceae bacterium]|nr:hypothetical protein [Candidatus Peribacteraceae bacterium]MDD5739996.1 hypothetical protein [Candidatus Peribacteraceae bacterium]